MYFESLAAPLPARSSLKNHHICQKIWQKLKKMLVQLTFKRLFFPKAHPKQVTQTITSIHIHHDTIILVLSEQIGTNSTNVLSFKIIAISNDNELYSRHEKIKRINCAAGVFLAC